MSSTKIFFKAQHFINNPSTATMEALVGLVESTTDVGLLDFGKVVVRRDYREMREVKIISGGSSGHDPAFAGFVGKGMLTAAIQGDVFTSPPSNDILRVIRELTNEENQGIIVIIPNSPGDRLNFGLAVERARNEGSNVGIIIVSDDCTNYKPNESRGLCGAFLLQKIAGAMARNGANFRHITETCQKLKEDIFSLLLSVQFCTAKEKSACESCRTVSAKIEMEIGAGLRGERGRIKMSMTAVEHVCKMIFEKMMDENNERKLAFEENVPVVLFVNNLGTTTKLEEYIFIKELLKYFKSANVTVCRLFCDRFLTSLDMYGFSVTVMKVRNPEVIEWLDQKCEVPCWREGSSLNTLENDETFIMQSKDFTDVIEMRGPRLNKKQSNTLLLVTQFACDAIISCEKQLNLIDAEWGSGNIGYRLKRGMDTINSELSRHNLNLVYPFVFLLTLSRLLESDIGGTLGCIYGILAESAAKEFLSFPESHHVGAWLWLHALKRAVAGMIMYAESKQGDNTMFDPLFACAQAMEESLHEKVGDVEAFGNGVFLAEDATQKTRIPPKKYPDPGAHAVGIWLRALYEGVKLRCE